MNTQFGIQLARHVISSSFGDVCAKVCESLLRSGPLSLIKIGRFTELPKEDVCECLVVLIHQNCIQAFSIEEEDDYDEETRIITKYMALFDNIVHKLRAAKVYDIVEEECGEDCLGIFQGLIEHGRQSFSQIIDRAEHKTGNSDVQVVKNNFTKLLSAHFIERCPAPEPFLAPPTEEETSDERGTEAVKIAEQTIEQRASAAAAPLESLRFLMEMDEISEGKDKETDTTKGGKKPEQDVLNPDEDVSEANRKKEVLWRVNFEEFVWRLLHKACIAFVKTEFSNESSIVLSAILDLSRRSETQLKADKTPYLSRKDIYDEVIKKDGGVGMDLDHVNSSLHELDCQILDESYSVDIKRILQRAATREVESVLEKTYGRKSKGIFRLLLNTGSFVEIDEIAAKTFADKTEAFSILTNLWKDGYIHMETVTGRWTRQQWKVERVPLRQRFLDNMYHCWLNLRLRLGVEKEQRKDILQIPYHQNLPEETKKQKRIYQVIRTKFATSCLDLSDAILVFEHYW